MKLSELRKVLKLAQAMGVKSLKHDGFEIEFHSSAPLTDQPSQPVESPEAILDSEPMPSEEEFLYMSTDYDPKAKQRTASLPEVSQ